MSLRSSLEDALEERAGLRTAWRWLSDEELPGGARWAYVFGSLLAGLLLVQAASGVVLALDYAPTVDAAHASVSRIMDPEQAPLGPLVRGLHHFGASFLIVLLVMHLVQVAWTGAYKRPREASWLTGLALAGVLFGFAFTGYLLPWDQTAYYATRVGLGIASSTPGGAPMARLLQGGDVMGNLTLTRFYVIHVVLLPAALLGIFGLHFALFRRRGVTPVLDRDGNVPPARQPFWPHQAAKDAIAMLVVLGALVAVSAIVGAPLGEKADPSVPFDARPEWYFFWLFQLLHFFEPPWDWVGTMLIPGAMAAFLVLLPWLDRGADRRPSARKIPLAGLSALLALVAVLTAWVFVADATRADAPAEAGAGIASRRAGPAVEPVRAGLLFGKKCTECHRIDGAPEDPDAPDFRDPEFARAGRRDFGRLMEVIRKGGEIMPAFEEELTEAEMRAILDHVVLQFGAPAATSPDAGEGTTRPESGASDAPAGGSGDAPAGGAADATDSGTGDPPEDAP